MCSADPSVTLDVVSEFSGIGALEHGLHAGFEEAGLAFRLIEACETDRTKEGRHAAAVLHKRFPDCLVLSPEERETNPYPEDARILTATPQCTEHSGLNSSRSPWLTETTMLEPVISRLAAAPQIECVVMENVPNFAKTLDGQDRSSYSFWVEGLTRCGFSEHAYVILPTAAAGDLHHRVRLLSVHTRGSFHPAAALMRLLEVNEDEAAGIDSMPEETPTSSEAFAFTTGLSEARAFHKGCIGHVFGALPAYNTNLNAALFVRGSYYKLSPWLASRCSGLPDDYQSVWDFSEGSKVRKQPLSTCLSSALGNMVSPLQARELGYAIASELLEPRRLGAISLLEGALALPLDYQGEVPNEFPTSRAEATLCFSSRSSRRWHRITGRAFQRVQPAATLDNLCDEALRCGNLSLYTNLTDLNRCADDAMLRPYHRKCAARQYEHIQAKANEEMRRESRKALQPTRARRSLGGRNSRCVWVQCDSCLRWRRLDVPPAGASELPENWTCSMNGKPPFNRCDAPEEGMDESEVCPEWKYESADEPFSAESDRWLGTVAQGVGSAAGLDAVKREQMVRCNIAAAPFSPLPFDYYFKSRTAHELQARADELTLRRSGAIVPTATQEHADTDTSRPDAAVAAEGEAAAEDTHADASQSDAAIATEGEAAAESDVEAGSEASDEIDGDEDEVAAAEILRHHVYSGRRDGSLYNVYVRIRYTDGSTTGDSSGAVEPSEPLCATTDGPNILAAYCSTKQGQMMSRFVPQYVLEAGQVLSNVERACRAGALEAGREAAAIRTAAAERSEAKRRKHMPRNVTQREYPAAYEPSMVR